jgi:hypothetical protein
MRVGRIRRNLYVIDNGRGGKKKSNELFNFVVIRIVSAEKQIDPEMRRCSFVTTMTKGILLSSFATNRCRSLILHRPPTQ